MGMFHYYDTKYAEFFVFDDFLIKQVKEGVNIAGEEVEIFRKILNTHFSKKNMAYISNRVTSYSIDPMVYKEAEKVSNLVAIAIIPANDKMRANAEIESKFYNRPFGIFDNLSDAINWIHRIIKKENVIDEIETILK